MTHMLHVLNICLHLLYNLAKCSRGPLCMDLRFAKSAEPPLHPSPLSPISDLLTVTLGVLFKTESQMRSLLRIVCIIDSFGHDQKTKLQACDLVEKNKETPRISERLDPPRVGRVRMKLYDVLGCLGNNKMRPGL